MHVVEDAVEHTTIGISRDFLRLYWSFGSFIVLLCLMQAKDETRMRITEVFVSPFHPLGPDRNEVSPARFIGTDWELTWIPPPPVRSIQTETKIDSHLLLGDEVIKCI